MTRWLSFHSFGMTPKTWNVYPLVLYLEKILLWMWKASWMVKEIVMIKHLVWWLRCRLHPHQSDWFITMIILLFQHTIHASLGGSNDGSSDCVPAICAGYLTCISGSCLRAGVMAVFEVIWGITYIWKFCFFHCLLNSCVTKTTVI